MVRTVRLPRWLFLLWSGLVYIWGILGYFGAGWGTDCHRFWGVAQACYTTFFPALNASSFQFQGGPDFPALLGCAFAENRALTLLAGLSAPGRIASGYRPGKTRISHCQT
jgi:hypothetical protein